VTEAAQTAAFRHLFRLYDLPGVGARRMRAGDRREVEELLAGSGLDAGPVLLALARFPVTAAVAEQGSRIVAAAFYDVRSPGVVGPAVAAPDSPGDLGRTVLLGALQAMHRHGYRYAVDDRVPPAWSAEVAALCGTPVREPALSATAGERDIEDLPWGDIFAPLLPGPHFLDGGVELSIPGVAVRTPEASERLLLVDWVGREFGRGWASEIERAFARSPVSCLMACRGDGSLPPEERLLGFTAYDVIAPGMGSTIAVHPRFSSWEERRALFVALVHAAASAMYQLGYEYIVASGISRRQLFLDAIPGAWTIPGSHPGPFAGVIAYK
jgi:hypothetical protein